MVSNWRSHSTFVRYPGRIADLNFDSPGRFFAVNELKCLMGNILLNYDIKWSNRGFLEGGYTPPSKAFGIFTRTDENTTIMFRRRIQV